MEGMRTEWNESEIIGGSDFKWSLMTDTDRQTIRDVVRAMIVSCDILGSNTLNLLEIGTYNSSTAWGVKSIVESKGKILNYWGIDTMRHDCVMWPEANMIYGDSTEVFHMVPNVPFDILFIDGPHCSRNCMLDFLNYAPKVRVGGLIIFHDSSPASQCELPFKPEKVQEYINGGWPIPSHNEEGTSVLVALEKLGLSTGARTDYELVENKWTNEPFGGISIYRKLR